MVQPAEQRLYLLSLPNRRQRGAVLEHRDQVADLLLRARHEIWSISIPGAVTHWLTWCRQRAGALRSAERISTRNSRGGLWWASEPPVLCLCLPPEAQRAPP